MSAVKEKPVASVRHSELTRDYAATTTTTEKIYKVQRTSLAEAPELEAEEELDSAVIRAIRTKQKRRKIKMGLLVKVMLVFALGLLVVFRYASITEMGYKVSEAKSQYQDLTADNERMMAQIENSMNLDELTKLAKEKFDMQRPQTYQMVVLDIDPADQTEFYQTELKEVTEDKAWYVKIYDGIREFLGLI
ncbi:MAG: hypothetical protein E7388_05815 [Ruminococcaceae bacterium]|nr:hypothetical protein [Oscillospiraceae bacterium]